MAITPADFRNPASDFTKSASRPRVERQTLPPDSIRDLLKYTPRRGTVATSALKAVHAIEALTGAKIGNVKFKPYEKLTSVAQTQIIDHTLSSCVTRRASSTAYLLQRPQSCASCISRVHVPGTY